MEFSHISVLKEEVIENLTLKDDGVYVDGTFGGGGHTEELLKRTSPYGFVIGIDKDTEALANADKRLFEYKNRIKLVHDDFKNISKILEKENIDGIDGAILDLGVSSYQLDNRSRGFSYMASETRLDMRMNREQSLSAYDVVNKYSERELFNIINDYGEEQFAKNIAKNIVLARQNGEIKTTGQLVEIIDKSIPYKFKQTGHPAKKTFQAIRIEVNEELSYLKQTMYDFVKALKKGGRLAVITFHSLEDRIVKNAFKFLESDCICDKSLPICICGKIAQIKSVTRKPIIATLYEQQNNQRSKSAKLRVVQKIV